MATMLLQGTLQDRSLARVLYVLYKKRMTGSIRIEDPARRNWRVMLREGYVVDADLPVASESLGRVLFEMGLISMEPYNDSLIELAKGQTPHGQILLAMGALDQPALQRGLSQQILRKVTRVMGLESGTIEVMEEAHPRGARSDVPRVDPRFLIHHGVRRTYSGERLGHDLSVLEGKVFKLIADEEAQAAYGFAPDDLPLLEQLGRGYLDLVDLKELAGRQFMSAQMVVYCLLVSEGLDVKRAAEVPAEQRVDVAAYRNSRRVSGTATATSGGGASGTLTVAKKLTPEAEQTRAEIAHKAKVVMKQNLFEVLGVERVASTDEVRKAYFALAKVYHPDRLQAQGLEVVHGDAATVLARVNQAYATLADLKKRQEYVLTLASAAQVNQRMKDEDRAQKIIGAELSFEKAEVLLRRRDFAVARDEAQNAVAVNPTEGAYIVLAAWTRYAASPAEQQAQLAAKTRTEIDRGLKLDPKYANGHFWLAQLLRLAGDEEAAFRAFQQTIKLDPRNVDAEREVRVYTMRKQKSAGGPPDRLKR